METVVVFGCIQNTNTIVEVERPRKSGANETG